MNPGTFTQDAEAAMGGGHPPGNFLVPVGLNDALGPDVLGSSNDALGCCGPRNAAMEINDWARLLTIIPVMGAARPCPGDEL